jgi:hypothetical protein
MQPPTVVGYRRAPAWSVLGFAWGFLALLVWWLAGVQPGTRPLLWLLALLGLSGLRIVQVPVYQCNCKRCRADRGEGGPEIKIDGNIVVPENVRRSESPD